MAEVKHTLFTCVTCDPAGGRDSPDTLGNKMYQTLKEAVAADPALCEQMKVQPVKCMGNCTHACTIGFAAPNKMSWAFNQQTPDTLQEVLDTARVYIARDDGLMLRQERAPALRASVICKMPPVE